MRTYCRKHVSHQQYAEDLCSNLIRWLKRKSRRLSQEWLEAALPQIVTVWGWNQHIPFWNHCIPQIPGEENLFQLGNGINPLYHNASVVSQPYEKH